MGIENPKVQKRRIDHKRMNWLTGFSLVFDLWAQVSCHPIYNIIYNTFTHIIYVVCRTVHTVYTENIFDRPFFWDGESYIHLYYIDII